MAWTSADLTAIESAISKGAMKVKYGDKELTYRSLDEMLRVRDKIRKDLGLTNSTQKIFPKFAKGL